MQASSVSLNRMNIAEMENRSSMTGNQARKKLAIAVLEPLSQAFGFELLPLPYSDTSAPLQSMQARRCRRGLAAMRDCCEHCRMCVADRCGAVCQDAGARGKHAPQIHLQGFAAAGEVM